jgi:hypothetical protein
VWGYGALCGLLAIIIVVLVVCILEEMFCEGAGDDDGGDTSDIRYDELSRGANDTVIDISPLEPLPSPPPTTDEDALHEDCAKVSYSAWGWTDTTITITKTIIADNVPQWYVNTVKKELEKYMEPHQ